MAGKCTSIIQPALSVAANLFAVLFDVGKHIKRPWLEECHTPFRSCVVRRRGGRMILTSSAQGQHGTKSGAAYSESRLFYKNHTAKFGSRSRPLQLGGHSTEQRTGARQPWWLPFHFYLQRLPWKKGIARLSKNRLDVCIMYTL